MSSTEKATRCMPISLGRVGSVSIASGWMYSKSSRRPLPSGVWSIAILAWLPSRPTAVSVHSPLTVSRPRTVSPRSVKKAIVASRSRTAMPTFSSLMGMPSTLQVRVEASRSAAWTDRSDGDRDLAANLACLEPSHCLRRLVQRVGPVDARRDLPLVDQGTETLDVGAAFGGHDYGQA